MSLFLSAAALSLPFGTNAQSDGTWRFHPSFNISAHQLSDYNPNHTFKVMDGPRYTYFLVFQRPYIKRTAATNYGDTQTPSMVLFRVDNTLPQSPGVPAATQAVSDLPGVSGTTVRMAEYAPQSGVLAVVYDNRRIDLIHDSGKIVNIPTFRMMSFRNFEPRVDAISFDLAGKEAYVSGNFGFFIIDIEKGSVSSVVETETGVTAMGRLGDHLMVSLEDGLTYIADAEAGRESFSSFVPLEIDQELSSMTGESGADKEELARSRHFVNGILRSMLEFLPVNENLMAAFYQIDSSSATNMILLDRSDKGTWRLCCPRSISHLWEPAGWSPVNPYSSLRYRTQSGIGLNAQTSVYYLRDASFSPDYTAANPSADYLSGNMIDIRLEWNRNDENKETYLPPSNVGQRFASYNQKDHWFYASGLGWIRRHYDESSKSWTDLTGYTLPNAPPVSMTTEMVYVPGRGMVVRQPGQVNQLDVQSALNPDVVSIYRDGKWSSVSSADISLDAAKDMVNYIGVSVDPRHPAHYYAGSTRKGFIRRNFDDPSEILLISSDDPSNTLRRFETYIPGLPTESWKACIYVTCPTFDANGNMWFLRNNFTQLETELCLWKSEDVEAGEKLTSDPDSFRPFIRTITPMGTSHGGNLLLACTYPGNENYLIAFTGGNNVLGFIDTKGETDLDKIEIKRYSSIPFENAGESGVFGINQFVEDPATGYVWFTHQQGVAWIDPKEFAEGKGVVHRVRLEEGFNSRNYQSPFDMISCLSICIDPLGRKWIGTKDTGVYCLSADGRKLLAHLGPDNSPVESGEIMSVAWNGDRASLMLSAREGIFEFMPYDSDTSLTPARLRVWPSTVEADYEGYVTLTGVPAGTFLTLHDATGREVRSLPRSTDGVVQFPVRDSAGIRLAPGSYTLTAGEKENVGSITVF